MLGSAQWLRRGGRVPAVPTSDPQPHRPALEAAASGQGELWRGCCGHQQQVWAPLSWEGSAAGWGRAFVRCLPGAGREVGPAPGRGWSQRQAQMDGAQGPGPGARLLAAHPGPPTLSSLVKWVNRGPAVAPASRALWA